MNRYVFRLFFGILVGLMGCDSRESVLDRRREVVLDEIATLGTRNADFSPHFGAQVALWMPDGDTLYVLSQTHESGFVHAYDPAGSIVHRIGGPGEGPGELGGLAPMVVGASEAQLWVGSQFSPRLTSFDLSGSTSMTTLESGVVSILGVSDGELLLVPNGGQAPLLFAPDGSSSRVFIPDSFGTEDRFGFVVGPAESDLAWVAHSRTAEVGVIDDDGVVRPRMSLPHESEQNGALPGVVAIAESGGVLWVGVTVRRAEVAPGTPFSVGVLDSIFDTRLLALDPLTGDVIATTDDPRALSAVSTNAGFLLSHVFETDIGDTRVSILRPRLEAGEAR